MAKPSPSVTSLFWIAAFAAVVVPASASADSPAAVVAGRVARIGAEAQGDQVEGGEPCHSQQDDRRERE